MASLKHEPKLLDNDSSIFILKGKWHLSLTYTLEIWQHLYITRGTESCFILKTYTKHQH